MNEARYQLFDRYIHNELDTAERKDFETQLQSDSTLAESFKLYQETLEHLEISLHPNTLAFKQNLNTISKTHFASNPEPSQKVIPLRSWFAVAASVVFFAGLWFLMQKDLPVYTDYNQHEQASFIERGNNDDLLQTAQKEFNNKNYELAEDAFRKILAQKASPEIQFYFAITLIENNQFAEAELELKKIQKGSSIYKDKSIWYLALSELKQKNPDACKEYLLQIKEPHEDYEKAQKLLGDL